MKRFPFRKALHSKSVNKEGITALIRLLKAQDCLPTNFSEERPKQKARKAVWRTNFTNGVKILQRRKSCLDSGVFGPSGLWPAMGEGLQGIYLEHLEDVERKMPPAKPYFTESLATIAKAHEDDMPDLNATAATLREGEPPPREPFGIRPPFAPK